MGTRREEIQASIELTYRLAKDLGDEVGVLADIEYGEPVAKAVLELSDALQWLLSASSPGEEGLAWENAWELLSRLSLPIRGKP